MVATVEVTISTTSESITLILSLQLVTKDHDLRKVKLRIDLWHDFHIWLHAHALDMLDMQRWQCHSFRVGCYGYSTGQPR
jgi:hypothetical protein